MIKLPKELALLELLGAALPSRIRQRFLILALGAIVAMGRRTVSRILWAIDSLKVGHASSYHRFFSKSRWSMLSLGRVLATLLFKRLPKDKPIVLLVDDTVVKHRGDKVYGKAWHRDAVKSSDKFLVKTLGHKWVVLAASVLLPGCKRPWALPLLSALYVAPPKLPASADGQRRRQAGRPNASMRSGKSRSGKSQSKKKVKLQRSKLPVLRKCNRKGILENRYKSPCLLARQLLALLMYWFPDRKFIFIGDGGFASHELALFCWRHRRQVTLISRFHPDARLYTLPSDRLLKARSKRPAHRRGRKPMKGPQLPRPQESVESASSLPETTLPWYGQSVRRAKILSAAGGWYRCRGSSRGAIIPIRWVYVHELEHDGEAYFYSTDLTLSAQQISGYFACRWSIEVTFQEVRAHMGFATTRQRCRKSVLRTAPCLLGLFSVVSLIYARIANRKHPKLNNAWRGKREPSFVDALTAVRRVVWTKIILPRLDHDSLVAKLPRILQNLLLQRLTAAA